MTLREVQLFGLDILKDVHDFCTTNNIRYSLGYGTLLGAVRHNGFIPWDDDIDIIMPRPDYEQFCRTFKSKKGFEVFSPVMGNCYLNYARVCDLEKTYVHSLAWCEQSPTGFWIDIFPIDGINPNENCKEELDVLKEIHKRKTMARIPMDNLSRPMPMKRKIKTIFKKIIFFWANINQIVEEYERIIKKVDFTTSEWCGVRTTPKGYWKQYPKSYFDSYIDIEFEGTKFKAITEYKEFLKTAYGDYMQLPPEEERKRHPQEMYWRK